MQQEDQALHGVLGCGELGVGTQLIGYLPELFCKLLDAHQSISGIERHVALMNGAHTYG